MKKILSAVLVLLVVGFTVLPASAGSIYFSIPLWGNTTTMNTTFSVTSLGDLTKNIDFASTGATVAVTLYNNVITKGTTTNWQSVAASSGSSSNTWANISKTFSTGEQNLLADTSLATATDPVGSGWTTGTTSWSNTTANWGYGIITVSSTNSTPTASDFDLKGFFYGAATTGVFAGFPITITQIQ